MTECKDCRFYGKEESYIDADKKLVFDFRCEYGCGKWHTFLKTCKEFRRKRKMTESKEPVSPVDEKICLCGDHTKNLNGICDTCEFTDSMNKPVSPKERLKEIDRILGEWAVGYGKSAHEERTNRFLLGGETGIKNALSWFRWRLAELNRFTKDPYPTDIFRKLNKNDWAKIRVLLADGGYTIDCVSANLMKRGYNLGVEDMKKEVSDLLRELEDEEK